LFQLAQLIFSKKLKYSKADNAYWEPEKFHEKHIQALEECLKEFELKTITYKDLNSNYDGILSNDIRGLYASYFLMNNEKQPKYPSLMSKFKEMIQPAIYKLKDYIYKKIAPDTNELKILQAGNKYEQDSPFFIEVAKLIIYIIMYLIHYFLSFFGCIYELVSDAKIQYSAMVTLFFQVVNYYLAIFKSIVWQIKSLADVK